MDIKKGQKVWINADFCGTCETEIISVGSKYITVKAWKIKFDKNTFREVKETGSGAKLIFNLEKYKKECEIQKLKQKLYRYDWDKVDVERLEKVYEIMKDII